MQLDNFRKNGDSVDIYVEVTEEKNLVITYYIWRVGYWNKYLGFCIQALVMSIVRLLGEIRIKSCMFRTYFLSRPLLFYITVFMYLLL